MHVKITFDPVTGQIFGAQVAGGEGVDRRIDSFAVAIHAKMTVFDLEEVELAYAPPYGTPRDPVNFAGAIAANSFRNEDKYIQWSAALTGTPGTLLDIRDQWERDELGYIPESLHIPCNDIRDRVAEIPRDKPVYVYCAAGVRAHTISSELRQLGFDSFNVTGGWDTYVGMQYKHLVPDHVAFSH